MEAKLQQLLDVYKVSYINDLDDFSERLLDLKNIEKQRKENILKGNSNKKLVPTIKAKRKSIIIFDNHDFNETYLIDLLNNCLNYLSKDDCLIKNSETNEEINTNGWKFFNIDEIDFYYVDDYLTRLKCFNPSIYDFLHKIFKSQQINDYNIKNIERYYISPTIMFFNPNNKNEINCIFEKQLNQITENSVMNVFAILKEKNIVKNEDFEF